MKRLLVIICLLLHNTNWGQCPNSMHQLDIAASYGIISPDQVNLGTQTGNDKLTYISGATYISVRYFLYAYLSLGFSGGIISEQGQTSYSYDPTIIKSTYTQQVTTIGPEIYYVYTYRKYLEIYTLLGAGIAFTKTTTTTNATPYNAASVATTAHDGIKMQYTPLGIRTGGHISAFVELGFGYKGVVNAGLSFKFGHPMWWKQ